MPFRQEWFHPWNFEERLSSLVVETHPLPLRVTCVGLRGLSDHEHASQHLSGRAEGPKKGTRNIFQLWRKPLSFGGTLLLSVDTEWMPSTRLPCSIHGRRCTTNDRPRARPAAERRRTRGPQGPRCFSSSSSRSKTTDDFAVVIKVPTYEKMGLSRPTAGILASHAFSILSNENAGLTTVDRVFYGFGSSDSCVSLGWSLRKRRCSSANPFNICSYLSAPSRA
jgi:hypothetical protein